jgi:Tfp pilus assembly protein PilN
VNLVLILSILIFIITTSAAGGVYLYKSTLMKQKEEKDTELVEAKKSFGLADIAVLKQRSAELQTAKTLLQGHTSALPLFALIQENTLKSVRFKSFSLTKNNLTLSGEARGFNAVAYQSQVFTKVEDFRAPTFSGFVLQDSGNVSFSFSAVVSPKLLRYANTVGDVNGQPSATPDNSLAP